jgi:hypothetical protein
LAKPKKSLTSQLIKEPVVHTTRDGYGRGSRPRRRGKKPMRGQGRG